jgi:hypothetical protein
MRNFTITKLIILIRAWHCLELCSAITIHSECCILPSKVDYVLYFLNNLLKEIELMNKTILHCVTK